MRPYQCPAVLRAQANRSDFWGGKDAGEIFFGDRAESASDAGRGLCCDCGFCYDFDCGYDPANGCGCDFVTGCVHLEEEGP